MKKQRIRPVLGALCAALLLAGCGDGAAQNAAPTDPVPSESAGVNTAAPEETAPGGEAPEEEPTAPADGYAGPALEEIRANNTLDALLERHTAASYREEDYPDGLETPFSTSEGQFYRDADGYLRVDIVYENEGGKRYVEGFADQDFAGARYDTADLSGKSMCIFPSGEYESFMAELWIGETIGSEGEMPVEYSFQDGSVVVVTLTTYPAPTDSYLRTMYILDGEYGNLLYREVCVHHLEEGQEIPDVPYGMDENEITYLVKTTFSYDEPREYDGPAPHEEVIGQHADYCELSVIEDYGADAPVVRWYPVARDTELLFLSLEDDYKLYADAELTREIDFLDELDISGEAANLFLIKLPRAD